jgi:FkbM family methyltransferase
MFTYACLPKVVPGGRIIAIEPDDLAARFIVANGAINGFSSVVDVHIAALGATPGTVVMTTDLDVSNHMQWVEGETVSRASAEVRVVTLDVLDPGPVALLKLDVEGAEMLALTGGRQLLGDGEVRVIAMEAHDHSLRKMGSSRDEVHSLLQDFAYEPFEFDVGSGAFERTRAPGANSLFVSRQSVNQVLSRFAQRDNRAVRV